MSTLFITSSPWMTLWRNFLKEGIHAVLMSYILKKSILFCILFLNMAQRRNLLYSIVFSVLLINEKMEFINYSYSILLWCIEWFSQCYLVKFLSLFIKWGDGFMAPLELARRHYYCSLLCYSYFSMWW